ncbi:MAG: GntR family transcriptional regulator [Anaerolineales bacterium]|nr:GntR family transcriptional regulator [Anaerolineales bacterium]
MVRRNVPLAQQVVYEILSGIETGNLARENGLLPSESDLSKRFDVSRATVREALSRLEQRGVVIRRHGVGTFVAPRQPVLEAGLERLESLSTVARRMGLETRMGEAEILERPSTLREAECLGIPSGSPVLCVSRVILTNEQPFAYLVDIVPNEYLKTQDLGDSFTGSVLDVFLQRGEVPLSHSRTDILTEAADGHIAHRLHMQPGETLLKLEAQLYTRDGRVIDYSLSYFVPGYFRFRVIRRIDPCD